VPNNSRAFGPGLHPDADFPKRKADSLAEIERPLGHSALSGFFARGTVDLYSACFEHAFGSKDMIAVADQNTGIEIHPFHNLGGGSNGVHGRGSLRFGNYCLGRNAAVHEVGATHVGFGENGIAAGAAGGHDHWRQMLFIETQCMIETGAKHRGRAATVFGGSHHDDDVGVGGFVLGGLPPDSNRKGDKIIQDECQRKRRGQTGNHSALRYSDFNIVQRYVRERTE
jgi:hypothetical protein